MFSAFLSLLIDLVSVPFFELIDAAAMKRRAGVPSSGSSSYFKSVLEAELHL